MIPGIALFEFILGVGYPLHCTYKALFKSDIQKREGEYIKWTVYWVLYTLTVWAHATLLHYLIDYIPLFPEIKCLVLFWLVYSDFDGIVYLWEVYFRSAFLALDNSVTSFREARLQGLMNYALDSAPAHPMVDRTKADRFAASRNTPPTVDVADVTASDVIH